MTGNDIISRATSMGQRCVYWYGGKRQVPTVQLAQELMRQNPSVWNSAYYDAALKDVGSGKLVCDCSGLVCYAYNKKDVGTSTMRSKYKSIERDIIPDPGNFTPGMIGWKPGHCGIIIDKTGHIAEMRGLRYDFSTTRTFKECGFTAVLYDPGVVYEEVDTYTPGWNKDKIGWWYAYGRKKGEYYRSSFENIGGAWYHFDVNGYIDTGIFKVDGRYYASTEYGIIAGDNGRKIEAKSDADIRACFLTMVG